MDLRPLFRPRSVAIIGASDNNPWPRIVTTSLLASGFDGPVHLINKRGTRALGRQTVTSCTEVKEDVDAAFIAVPAAALDEALDDMANAGWRHGSVVTSGFAETGGDGAALQKAIFAKARERGLTLLGPNSLGVLNFADRAGLAAIPVPQPPPQDGHVALVSQSGATASLLVQQAHRQNIGLSHAVALGNEAMIDMAEVLTFLIEDERVRAIAVFAETIRRPAQFLAAAKRALALSKPIVILKVGASELTAEVAQAHTGALVGDDRVFDAVCRQYGLVRVKSLEQLIVTSGLLAHTGVLDPKGFAGASISGGACELMADAGAAAGVPFVRFAPSTLERLKGIISDYGAAHNPLDITGAAVRTPKLFEDALAAIATDPDVAILACTYDPPAGEGLSAELSGGQLKHIAAGLATASAPTILIEQTMRDMTPFARDLLADANAPLVLPGISGAMEAIGAAFVWSDTVRRGLDEAPSPSPSNERPHDERATLKYLSAADVPVIPASIARSSPEARQLAETLAGPVALKILSRDIAHKTEVGGVALNVQPPDAGEVYNRIMAAVTASAPNARIEGVIVSPMRGAGLELIVGVARDPTFGPVIAVGFGGTLVEVLDDSALRLLPVHEREARRMLDELRGRRLLDGYRGAPAVNIDALASIIARIGNAAIALGPTLASLEINPLRAAPDRIEALDGLAVWASGPTERGDHA
jgi:acyl-CoA synthetase (NDP forming)